MKHNLSQEKSSLRVSVISRALGDESGPVAETVSLPKTFSASTGSKDCMTLW